MIGFLEIETFEFKKAIVEQAYSFLQNAGDQGFEAVALFAGRLKSNKAELTEVILPKQKSYKLESGLMYAVEGDELHRINVWLYQNNLKLFAQIHSHPRAAYHSEADDAYPIMSTAGGLSIVVPNFASEKLNHYNWAYYRLSETALWNELEDDEIKRIIQIC